MYLRPQDKAIIVNYITLTKDFREKIVVFCEIPVKIP